MNYKIAIYIYIMSDVNDFHILQQIGFIFKLHELL